MKHIKHYLAVFFLYLAHRLDARFVQHLTTSSQPHVSPQSYMDPQVMPIPSNPNPTGEPSGIIYRPTAQELAKMKEDQVTRDAKEAIAETLKSVEEPEL